MSGTAMAMLVVYLVWRFTGLGGRQHQQLIGDLATVPFCALAIVASLGAGRRSRAIPKVRRAWRLLAVANLCSILGELLQAYEEVVLHHLPYPSPADAAYLSFYGFFFAGLLGFARTARSATRRVMFGLDVLTVTLAGAILLWYLVAGPSAMTPGLPWLQVVMAVAYPLGDLLLLLGAATTLLRGVAPPLRRALLTATAGVGLYVLADVIWGYVVLHSTYDGGSWLDSLWVVAAVLFSVAPAQQPVIAPEDLDDPTGAPSRRAGWVPYLALGTTLALLLVVQHDDPPFPNLCVTIVAVAVALVIGTRQLLAQRALAAEQARTQELAARLHYLAFHDPLTGLANRALLKDRVERALVCANGNGQRVALFLVDMDGFKTVNDSFGHEQGDELLVVVAGRLQTRVRANDTVARLGGDEFVILVESADQATVIRIGQAILDVVSQPVALGADTVVPQMSVGIALSQPGRGPAELLRAADHALYQAKAAGRGCLRVFEDDWGDHSATDASRPEQPIATPEIGRLQS